MKTGHSSLLLLPCISMRQLVFGLVLGWARSACGQTAPAADQVAKQNALFEEFYQTELKNSPERATAYGDYRHHRREPVRRTDQKISGRIFRARQETPD